MAKESMSVLVRRVSVFFNDTATTEIYTLSLHDALPIFAGEHFIPGWQLQSRQIGGARFHPAAVFGDVGALDLDFNCADPGARGNIEPRIARELNRVNRIRDDDPAKAKVVLSERVGNAVTRIVDRPFDNARLAER